MAFNPASNPIDCAGVPITLMPIARLEKPRESNTFTTRSGALPSSRTACSAATS
jgi:hypothetical protein